MSHDVFISYSTHDKPVADAACAALEQRGIRCWIAPRDVPVGRQWASALVDAIGESAVFVLVLSNGAAASPQVTREVGEAVNNAIPIIPFRIDDVDLSGDLRYYIASIHWLDAMSPPLERHLDELATLVQTVLDGGTTPAPSREPLPSTRTHETPWYRRPAILGVAAAVVAVVLLVVALVGTGGDAADPEQATTDGDTPATVFEEDFDGEPDDGWTWFGDPDEAPITAEGRLEILAREASDTRLVRAAPTGPYEVVTMVEFAPTSDFQFAGLIVQDRAGGDWLQVGHAFCDPSIAECVGDGVYVDNFQDGTLFGLSERMPLDGPGDVYLRLTADGDRYATAFSTNGVDWIPLATSERDFSSPMVGVTAHQAREEPIVARFDFVTITELR